MLLSDVLREFFDADPDRCRVQYADLRARLKKYFDWRGCRNPDELTDETITRAVQRITEGAPVADLMHYCYGIARFIRMEEWKKRHELVVTTDLEGASASMDASASLEQTILAKECLRMVPPDEEILLREYFWGDRNDLADRLHITPNALRIRIYRILEKIRQLV